MEILWFSYVFLWKSYGFPMEIPWFSYASLGSRLDGRKVSMYVLMLPSLDARKLTWEGAPDFKVLVPLVETDGDFYRSLMVDFLDVTSTELYIYI